MKKRWKKMLATVIGAGILCGISQIPFEGNIMEVEAAENIASGVSDQITWVIDSEGHLTLTGTGEFMRDLYSPRPTWLTFRKKIVTAEINVTGMKNASHLFSLCQNLKEIDLSGFDTSNVVDMDYMFDYCHSLETLDLSGFDTSNVVDMQRMFGDCDSLETLDLSGFDTSNVVVIGCMFDGCSSLKTLDLSGFDTSNVKSMMSMFKGCSSLEILDLSGFDTSNVESMMSMFKGCSSLKTLDLSGFDTSNVYNMREMFNGCKSLETLDLSGFDTSNVEYVDNMFDGCSSLKTLDLSGFDTSNVESMMSMFKGCSSLKTLDLSGFDMSNVENVDNMFYGCEQLTQIFSPSSCSKKIKLPISLKTDQWYMPDGTAIEYLPVGLSESVLLTRKSALAIESFVVDQKKEVDLYDEKGYFSGVLKLQSGSESSTEFMNSIVKSIQWSSSDASIVDAATINCDGVSSYDGLSSELLVGFQPKKAGKVTITGILNGWTVSCEVTVKGNVQSFRIDKDCEAVAKLKEDQFNISGTIRLTETGKTSAEILASVINSIVWTSSNKNIIDASEITCTGVHSYDNRSAELTIDFIPKNEGKVILTGEIEGITASCEVTVIDKWKDTDGDGLPDYWEENGADVDDDGDVDVHIELMGADPKVPDIFIEIDWMHRDAVTEKFLWWTVKKEAEIDLRPSEDAMRMVYQQFREHNINLHIDAGPDSIDYVTGERWGALSEGNAMEYRNRIDLSENYDEWAEILEEHLSEDRSVIFRHCSFINKYRYFDGKDGRSGLANNIPGQFFLVADVDGGVSGEGTLAVAGTFMHELGHTLGLSHGGINAAEENDHTLYKPNYLSIMNYLFQMPGLLGLKGVDALNYSEYELPAIEESRIKEADGIDPKGVILKAGLGTKWYNSDGELVEEKKIAGKSIDFNQNKSSTEILRMNLNGVKNDDGTDCIERLQEVSNDWEHLVLKSGRIGTLTTDSAGALLDTDQEQLEFIQELSFEEAEKRNLLGHEGDCSIESISPDNLYTDIPGQKLLIKVNNLYNKSSTPTIKVTSDLLEASFEKTVMIEANERYENAHVIEIPITKGLKEGNYELICEVVCESGRVEKETLVVSVHTPKKVSLKLNGSKELISEETLKEMNIQLESTNPQVVSVHDGTVRGEKKGEAFIIGRMKDGQSIACQVVVGQKVTEIFTDVYDDWYTSYVQYVYDSSLMNGIAGTSLFQPNNNITKAQVAQVLYNMEGQPTVNDKKAFSDLKDVYEAEWYADAVAWAYNTGVVTGDLNTKKFSPNANVTREQLALMLYRYAQFKKYSTIQRSDLSGMKNAENVSNWANDGVRWAVGAGLISGIEKNGTKDLAPQGNASRAQVAAILMRFCEKYQDTVINNEFQLKDYHIPNDAFGWNGHYYAIFDHCTSWEEAQEYCVSRGGHLAVITSEEENAALFQMMKNSGYDSAYFGYHDAENEGSWKWVTEEESDYSNFNVLEPSGANAENYAMFFYVYEDGTWNDGAFLESVYEGGNAFICEWDSRLSIPTEAYRWENHDYMIFDNCKTWEEAENFCEFLGGHLATITSKEEDQAIYSYMKSNDLQSAYFGLTNQSDDGEWRWVNGERLDYQNWNSAEPSYSTGENYGMYFYVYPDGTWNDGAFLVNVYDGGNAYICEWDTK